VRVAIHCAAVVQHHEEVGDSVIVLPPLAAVAHVGTRVTVAELGPLDDLAHDVGQVADKELVRVVRHRRQNVHPLPDLLIQIDPLPLALLDELVRQSGISNQ
jgi:hypothetical protein